MGDIVQFPGAMMTMDKTTTDEQKLLEEVMGMLASGQDGVEAGLTTTEFWLTALALGIDVLGPKYGFLQGISPTEQGLIATGVVIAYGALRSWRKRGGPARLLAELGKLLAQARQGSPQAPATPPAAPAAAAEVPQAA